MSISKISKVAIVNWKINDPGGIDTYCENLITGFRRQGHVVRLFYGIPGKRMKIDANKKIVKTRYSLLPGLSLSYHPDCVDASVRQLEEYDVVIFMHPCPRPTTSNMEIPHILNWRRFYDLPKQKIITIFHDEKWRKTNYWFTYVAEKIDGIVAAQARFFDSVEEYPAECEKWWDYFPLDTEVELPEKRGDHGILATQWIKWKNHHRFLPQLDRILRPMHIYGSGMQYSYLKKGKIDARTNSDWEWNINDHHTGETEENSIHHYFGYVSYERVLEDLKNSLFSIDLSTRGYTNMTHWEPLLYGSISMITKEVAADPNNQIPREFYIAYDLDNAADAINSLHDTFRYNRKAAREWIVDKCNCEGVAKRMLEKIL